MTGIAPVKPLRVAICGGGISGLCLAVALCRFSHIKVDVYEAAEQFKEIGAGVMIWSRTWRILQLLGLADAFSKVAHAPPDGTMGVGFDFRRSDSPNEGYRFRLVEMPYGCIRFHRAHFLDVLVEHLPKDVAHFGKRVVSYSQPNSNGPVTIEFADGIDSQCDVLVACDGIKSTIRGHMYQTKAKQMKDQSLLSFIEPFWSGTVAYRGLFPTEKLARSGTSHRALDAPMMYCGQSKHVVSYSIAQGSIVNVVTFASKPKAEGSQWDGPWVAECPKAELLECYAGWEPEVEELLKNIEQPTKWAIHQLQPLPFYVMGRVALVGDAAHAMTPHQGAGAGQAIEDAFVLASLLGRCHDTDNLDSALKAYEHVRLPLATHVLNGSRMSGKMYEFDSQHGSDYATLGPAIQGQWDWINWSSPEEDVQRAVDYLKRDTFGSKL
ncbi:hypothetical protein HGRIS_002497 [Hohenbuehelia grisea]|uniref:FAD-binding domain-containing protein n=1 Tax=Hohenbuehelia grisea TaxID=104357 RepID=A0ABR3JLE0_9AGAR